MPYWIEDNGEKLGPMPAIEVLRRAQPTTRVYDGEEWFLLDDDLSTTETPPPKAMEPIVGRVVIRESAS